MSILFIFHYIFLRLAKQSQFIPLQNAVYFITLPFLVRKIFTFYINDVLLFKFQGQRVMWNGSCFALYLMRRTFLAFTGCKKILEHTCILPFQETGNILNFCEVGLKISGVAPISSQAAIHFPNTSLASVSMASTERHTVAFLGTSDGKLKKVSYCIQLSNTFQRIVTEIAFWLSTDFSSC